MTTIREKPLLLGERESMLAIASEPEDGPKADAPLLLLLNAGIVHRIGPHRKTVQLARGLARAGYRAVRVDLSGIGDSPARRDNLDFEASAQADIVELLDHLSKLYDTQRFCLLGLCSGADHSYQAAVRDDRIVGTVFMDGYAYHTPEFWVRHYGTRLKKKSSWMTLAKRVGQVAQGKLRDLTEQPAADQPQPANEEREAAEWERAFPPKDEVERQLQQLVDRGFDMYWIFSGGIVPYYNYENQFRDAFKDVNFKNQLAVKYFENSNHTFTALPMQRQLVQAIVAWVTRTY